MEEPKSPEVDLELVKKRSLSGIIALTSRTFLLQIISFSSTFLLTIFLDPKVFGVFFLVSAFINFFSYFSDVGLAAALIQKKDKISQEDLRTTFFVQQLLALSLLIVIFSLSPLAKKWYDLNQSSIYLLFALGISFFLSSLKTIPSVLLERNLKFNLLVIPQIVETIIFNLVVVTLAWKGMGVDSFTWAVLARAISGLLVIYIVSPWRIGFAFSKQSLKELLRFGVPYQINSFIAVLKDDLMTVILGKIVGTAGLGYLGWAKKWAEQPLRFFMDNVLKVAFPAFSRLQDDRENLKKALEKSLLFLSFLTFPVLVGFSILASDMVKVIPRYLKWQPALLALYFYCFNSAWAVVSTSMTNLLNATGRIKTTFKLMLMWLALSWALMPVLGIKFGFNGVAGASALIALSSLVAIIIVRKHVKFNFINPVGKPLFASFLMGAMVYFFNPNFSSLGLSICLRIIMGIVIYLLASRLLLGNSLLKDISLFVSKRKMK